VRVVHVSAYYAPAYAFGGPPRSIHGLCRALRRRGVDIDVLTTDADGTGRLPAEVAARREYEGVPVRYAARSRPAWPIGSRELAVALRACRCDLLHIHGLWNRVVWAAAREARRRGIPYVLSPRGMLQGRSRSHHAWRKRVAYSLIERRTVTGAALLHATSLHEADDLRRQLPGAAVAVIPNGVELPVMRNGAERDDREPATILFVGRVHPVKRLDLLVDAFVLTRRRRPEARLVIAGPDEGGLRSVLDARAGDAAAGIIWTGAVDTATRDSWLARASALALCSDSESFGMTVVEAMAAGTPVVVTESCGWESVREHGAGVVAPQNAPALAAAFVRMLDDSDGARVMGSRGRALAEREYDWDRIAGRFIDRYAEIIAAGQARGLVPDVTSA
jgi:glycosyltransferase involved in cell wall biosynthesis